MWVPRRRLITASEIAAGAGIELRFRLSANDESDPIDFDAVFHERIG